MTIVWLIAIYSFGVLCTALYIRRQLISEKQSWLYPPILGSEIMMVITVLLWPVYWPLRLRAMYYDHKVVGH